MLKFTGILELFAWNTIYEKLNDEKDIVLYLNHTVDCTLHSNCLIVRYVVPVLILTVPKKTLATKSFSPHIL